VVVVFATCFRAKIIFSGDSLPTDINFFDLTLFKPTPSYVAIFGNVNAISSGIAAAKAKEPSAVTFTRSGAFIRLSLWDARTSGSVEFHFKTLEPHGLLVSGAACDNYNRSWYKRRNNIVSYEFVWIRRTCD